MVSPIFVPSSLDYQIGVRVLSRTQVQVQRPPMSAGGWWRWHLCERSLRPREGLEVLEAAIATPDSRVAEG